MNTQINNHSLIINILRNFQLTTTTSLIHKAKERMKVRWRSIQNSDIYYHTYLWGIIDNYIYQFIHSSRSETAVSVSRIPRRKYSCEYLNWEGSTTLATCCSSQNQVMVSSSKSTHIRSIGWASRCSLLWS